MMVFCLCIWWSRKLSLRYHVKKREKRDGGIVGLIDEEERTQLWWDDPSWPYRLPQPKTSRIVTMSLDGTRVMMNSSGMLWSFRLDNTDNGRHTKGSSGMYYYTEQTKPDTNTHFPDNWCTLPNDCPCSLAHHYHIHTNMHLTPSHFWDRPTIPNTTAY